ncbi:MAG: RusA family crossover junction endodeoxyribonuclease [Actinomycetota bacterium]|nr:RusA family crossover junction endodeoxyribonuclease [Actinomycetota bacterium]
MDPIEFVVPGTPISGQSPGPTLEDWKGRIRRAAREVAPGPLPTRDDVSLTITYLYEEHPTTADLDNLVKAIQDALAGILFDNDSQVCDLRCRRRDIYGAYVVADVSPTLVQAIQAGAECVYIRVEDPPSSEVLE